MGLLRYESLENRHLLTAVVFWTDSFESTEPELGGGKRTSNYGPDGGADGELVAVGDYFVRTTNAGTETDPQGMNSHFDGIEGSHFWRGEDLDNAGSLPGVLKWQGIPISEKQDLKLTALFGARGTQLSVQFEEQDFIRVEVQIDQGPVQQLLEFRGDRGNFPDVAGAAGSLALDTNGDSIGDGEVLSETLKEFGPFDIHGVGDELSIIISVSSNGNREEVALDNVRLTEWKAADDRLVGDVDLDNDVDFDDFLQLARNFGKSADAVWEDGDLNGNEKVDFDDFLLLAANFGVKRSQP